MNELIYDIIYVLDVAITANLWPDFNRVSVAEVFSVFFPSVIGIFAGASMSGDLRDPNEAIPKGLYCCSAINQFILNSF